MAPDNLSLAGKTALITGSGRENGVGAAIARAFAQNGAAVALHYVSDGSKPRAEKLAAEIEKEFGNKTTVVHGSVRDYQATREMVSQALKGLETDHIDILGMLMVLKTRARSGPLTRRKFLFLSLGFDVRGDTEYLNVLVNNAADGTTQPLLAATPEHIESSFGVNVYGPIYLTQAAVTIGKMPRGGRILNIGSVVSKMGMTVAAIYAAAKAAQDSLTASWAGEVSCLPTPFSPRGLMPCPTARLQIWNHSEHPCARTRSNGYVLAISA